MQASDPSAPELRLIRIYASPDGESHFQDLVIAPDAEPAVLAKMKAGVYRSAENPVWHTAPRRWFSINLTGEIEVEVSDGERRRIGVGQLVFVEDTTGKGHVTRSLGPVTNVFLYVPDELDVVVWARGPSADKPR